MLDALPDPMFMLEAGKRMEVYSGVIRRLGLVGLKPLEHNALPKSAESGVLYFGVPVLMSRFGHYSR